MKVGDRQWRTIWLAPDDWSVEIIDQTKLPHQFETRRLETLEDAAEAIALLESYGYEVHRQTFTASGRRGNMDAKDIDNIYVTKIGTENPDRMYIVSAHMDSFNSQSEDQSFAPGANDDGSGTALVLELARVFASLSRRPRGSRRSPCRCGRSRLRSSAAGPYRACSCRRPERR